ncbi:MAG: hypothetical protein JWN30_2643, partial [Bacilli bacterium]|nr:hypothetical protein [Bacilli bacterium]
VSIWMAHMALYREWRPQRFADLVGQEHLTRTLQNALRTNRFSHAYLFNGPRGTGKTSAAKIVARAINCEQGPAAEPCNECDVCLRILDGTNMDVREIDAASNRGIDEIREIRDKIKTVPTEARYKVYIIDEVHMLTPEAFNALLKTLEEPPPHVMFILATTEPHKLPATVVSRCQRFDFRRIMTRDIVDHLKRIASQRGEAVEEEAYWMIARYAEGGLRDALSLFDQVLTLGSAGVSAKDVEDIIGATSLKRLGELSRAIAGGDQREALLILTDLVGLGKDPGQLLREWTGYFRDLLLWKTAPDLAEMQDRIQYEPDFGQTADLFSTGTLMQVLELCGQAQTELRWQTQARLLVELLAIRLCRAQDDSLAGLKERLQEVEQQLELLRSGQPVVASARAPEIASVPSSTGDSARALHAQAAKPAATDNVPPASRAAIVGTTTSQPERPTGAEAIVARFAGHQEDAGQDRLKAVLSGWQRILEQVKHVKIQTQAWLVNGDPVAAVPGAILVAYKNQMHMETCLKDMHREIIEKVFAEILGDSYQLVGILATKWATLQGAGSAQAEAPVAGQQEQDTSTPNHDLDQLAKDVIAVFGSDRVEIVE